MTALSAYELTDDDRTGCLVVYRATGAPCAWHGRCTSCGDVIHLGPLEGGSTPYALAVALVVGHPPRCADCRRRPPPKRSTTDPAATGSAVKPSTRSPAVFGHGPP